ncbi:Las1-domain-containing protein [Calocera viscosa TUFC12733]|uniref:Las1-domain-containing protein n=1 Tax=Calocera viscosa (strain TUFC12733) TaxID=1330018 RepID=A0A167MBX4_CALVF|nr:Las1-domain-containing protein [Calocera viscosa TUFC12733]
MQLPRRVPWTSLSELEQVSEWIYSPDSLPQDRERALHRLSAWATITPLPSSLSATLALLSALSVDTPSPSQSLPARQAYTLALIRLVNGLVDPLQGGMYARPIAHIARQLGLPGWWVELRHQGTHEDLPGLAVLREAAHEALDWLYTHYFLPTLHASAPPSHQTIPSPPPLKAYKTLAKAIARDASLAVRSRQEMDAVLRAFDRWVGEVRVAVSRGGWGEEGERETMEAVSDSLLERGGLVPVSRKKRPTMKDPSLPSELATLWHRLLQHLQANHPLFAPALYSALLARLAAPVEGEEDSTLDACLVGWAVWTVHAWEEALGGRAEALAQACVALGETDDLRRAPLRALVRLLSEGGELEGRAEALLAISGGGRVGVRRSSFLLVPFSRRVEKWETLMLIVQGWEGAVEEMEARLSKLDRAVRPSLPLPGLGI